jgi:hypothetical protein
MVRLCKEEFKAVFRVRSRFCWLARKNNINFMIHELVTLSVFFELTELPVRLLVHCVRTEYTH